MILLLLTILVPIALYAISINVVGLKLQGLESRRNGGMGIYWNFSYQRRGNLQGRIFARGGYVFLSVKPFVYVFLSLLCGSDYSF